MKRFHFVYTYAVTIFLLIFPNVSAQKYVNDSCVLANGITGKCIRFENCPTGIELVHSGKGRPEHCGFEGKHPIICCMIKPNLPQRPVGEISRQKCSETYSGLPEIVDIQEFFKMLRKTIEEERRAGSPFTQGGAGVGGISAQPAKFPHMAVLGYGKRKEITWGCGGTLISERHILTAAHCIITHLGPVTQVRLGDLNLNLISDLANPQDFNISKTIVHPRYKPPSVYHDIAIIELSKNVNIDEFVRPGCLNTETTINDDKWSAIGWGVTSYLGTPADHLQEMNLRPFTNEECRKTYASTSKRRLSTGIDFKSQLCAGDAIQDTCQGDSGGPLQVKNSEFKRGYTVIGVISFGKPCGIGTGPAVYTRVSYYIKWIESIVWPL